MGRHRHPVRLLLSLAVLSSAYDTHDKWSSVWNNTFPSTVPACAQPCLEDVATPLDCWSYGCVCSENTLGGNFINGTKAIESCVSSSCVPTATAAVGPALYAFQSVCGVTLTATPTVGVSASAASTPIQTPAFDPNTAVLVDEPASDYNALDPCVRWVFNNCKATSDNSDNCKPRVTGDYNGLWTGLGVATQCSDAYCLCNGVRFILSLQKLYDAANYLCSIGFPTQNNASNPMFEQTVHMLAEYCSQEGGSVLGQWVISLTGYPQNQGMSQDTKVSIGVGVGSGVITVISTVLAWLTLRHAKK